MADSATSSDEFVVLTDANARVLTMGSDAARFFNISVRHSKLRNLLLYIGEGRATVAEDLRRVTTIAPPPPRDVILRPRERAACQGTVILSDVERGVQWTFRVLGPVPRVRVSPPRGGRGPR
jgi:hypothetical protein